jgi:WD40 repeat protein
MFIALEQLQRRSFMGKAMQSMLSSWVFMVCCGCVSSSDVLSVAFRPDGAQLCSSTRDGQLHYWNVKSGVADGVIEAHNDVSGGRKKGDARTAANSARAKCFTT